MNVLHVIFRMNSYFVFFWIFEMVDDLILSFIHLIMWRYCEHGCYNDVQEQISSQINNGNGPPNKEQVPKTYTYTCTTLQLHM